MANLPKYEISLSFTNNLLQTFLIDIYEKAAIKLNETKIIIPNSSYNSNTLSISHNSKKFYLIFQTKNDFTENVINSNVLIEYLISVKKITEPQNINLIFYQVNFGNEDDEKKNKLKFFLATTLKIKSIDLLNSNELIDYIYNLKETLLTKEEKSKIHFFDAKPVQSTNLCDVEGIKNKIWVKHLMCINGVSEIKAISIVKAYPTLSSLYDIYLSDQYSKEEKEHLLDGVEIQNKAKGSVKKIGFAQSSKIFKYYSAEDPNIII